MTPIGFEKCCPSSRHDRGAAGGSGGSCGCTNEHYARLWADREASDVGRLIDEQNRIERELEAAAKEACSLVGHSVGHITLQAASLMR